MIKCNIIIGYYIFLPKGNTMPKTEISKSSLGKGTDLYFIKDEKYKTNYLNLYFSMPLTKENATSASLLAKILKRGSKHYPAMSDLNAALTMNYSTGLVLSSYKQGEKTVFMVSLSTMKNKYAPMGEDVFAEALGIAFDVLLEPVTEDGAFKSEYFDSEKRNLRDSISAQINNKRVYSRTRFTETMHKGEPYAVNGEGDLDTLEKITGKELFAFLKNMLASAPCDIYFAGSEDEGRVKALLSRYISTLERTPEARSITVPCRCTEKKDVTEGLDITQAHLWIGYRIPSTHASPDHLKFVLLNMILGGDVSSKMFLNIREKLSLCYSCYSALDGIKGTLSAYAGISPENKDKTLNAFFDEVENIKSGRVTDKELDDAKRAYINRMREIEDNPSLLAAWFYIRLDSGRDLDPATEAEKMASLTLGDVIWAANQIELDTIYFLTKEA